MTNKYQSKYPYDRSEYVVMPPVRKSEDGTLTTEPQNVDGEFTLVKTEKQFDGKTFRLSGAQYSSLQDISLTITDTSVLAGHTSIYHPKQEPPQIDIEALKREVCEKYACDIEVETAEVRGIIRMLIDHLASAGYFRAPLPKIEGLEEGISATERANNAWVKSTGCEIPDTAKAVLKAARAYLKASGV